MRIANPLYDIVFKYLMEDNSLAKLVLSTILGEEITTLYFRSQEPTTVLASHSLTVFRPDFAATIKTTDAQYRQVLCSTPHSQNQKVKNIRNIHQPLVAKIGGICGTDTLVCYSETTRVRMKIIPLGCCTPQMVFDNSELK